MVGDPDVMPLTLAAKVFLLNGLYRSDSTSDTERRLLLSGWPALTHVA
jgi:hypothetical protein